MLYKLSLLSIQKDIASYFCFLIFKQVCVCVCVFRNDSTVSLSGNISETVQTFATVRLSDGKSCLLLLQLMLLMILK